MTSDTGPSAALLERIHALRAKVAALERAAGITAPPAPADEDETVRHGAIVLRGLMETLLIGFAIGDSRGRIMDANSAFANLLGYEPRELLDGSVTWTAVTPSEYAALDQAALDSLERSGAAGPYAKEYIRRDGSRIHVVILAVRATTERDEHAVFVLDDSLRYSAVQRTAHTQQLYRQVVDAIPDLVLLRDLDGRIVWANRAYLEFYATDGRSIAGTITPSGRVTPALRSELRDHTVVLETGLAIDLPRQSLERADGELRIFHTVRSPVIDPSGASLGTVSVARDVTLRTRAAERLRRSEGRLRSAQALAHVGSFEIRAPYTGDAYWSEEVHHILGLPVSHPALTPAEFIERFVRPDHVPLIERAMEQVTREGTPFDVTYVIVTTSGEERWVRGLAAPLRNEHESVVGVVGTLIDVTDQRRTDTETERVAAELRRAKELEAVGTLARGIAHDFNNLLGALTGYTELVREQASDDVALRADLDAVLHAATRASDLVEHVLAFGQPRDRLEASVAPERIVRDALTLMRTTLLAGFDVDEVLAAGLPKVRGDAAQLLQVVMGLCVGVVETMAPAGGVLRVRLEPFMAVAGQEPMPTGLAAGAYVRLTVTSAAGAPRPNARGDAREPTSRIAGADVSASLALRVVDALVREHGGALERESSPERGTTARVYLPALPAGDVVSPSVPSDVVRGAGQRVLLVEDVRELAELERRRLEELGYAPSVFTDPRRALEAFRQRPREFDLVLTDHAMPHLTGIDLAREIHRIRPEVPVVLISAYGEMLRSEVLTVAGIRGLLSKPVPPEVLARVLHDALVEPSR